MLAASEWLDFTTKSMISGALEPIVPMLKKQADA